MGVIADMIRAGVDPDLIERMAVEIADARVLEARKDESSLIESRRAADRARQAKLRASRDITLHNVTNVTEEVQKEKSPTPPIRKTTSSLRSDVYLAREQSEFIDWAWHTIPKRRGDSAKPFRIALSKALRGGADPDSIRSGLNAYAKFEVCGDPQFRKGAAVWVNAEGWTADYSKPPPARAGPPARQEKRNPVFQAYEELMAERYGPGAENTRGESADVFEGTTLELVANETASVRSTPVANGFARDHAATDGQRLRHEGDASDLRATARRFAG